MGGETGVQRTALYEAHLALGARMTPFGGFLMPLQYEGILKEHQAARTAAALFDTCHMGAMRLSGPTALPDLEALVSCDVAPLALGQCRYGLMCNPAGGVLDDLLVYRLASDAFMLVVNAATRAHDVEWVRAHRSTGTRLEDLCGRLFKVDLQGPGSPRIMRAVSERPIDGLGFYRFVRSRFAGRDVIVSRTGYTGEIGFEFYVEDSPETAVAFWSLCLELGARPAGLGARDTLRLEMGLPLYGHELAEDINAGESGFDRALSVAKRYVGCDAVRSAAAGGRRLVGIALDGRRSARRGDLLSGAGGETIGVVTSGSFAPSLGRAVALAYVARERGRPGTPVAARTGRGEALAGAVAPLPFYRQATGRRPIGEFLGSDANRTEERT